MPAPCRWLTRKLIRTQGTAKGTMMTSSQGISNWNSSRPKRITESETRKARERKGKVRERMVRVPHQRNQERDKFFLLAASQTQWPRKARKERSRLQRLRLTILRWVLPLCQSLAAPEQQSLPRQRQKRRQRLTPTLAPRPPQRSVRQRQRLAPLPRENPEEGPSACQALSSCPTLCAKILLSKLSWILQRNFQPA